MHYKWLSCLKKNSMMTIFGAFSIAIVCNTKLYLLDGILVTYACNQTC